jgi:nicotinate-nucleotide adenylyltransferase
VRRRIGLLGGTFDPIHVGHLDVATAAQAALGLTEVWIMPSHRPPHRPQPVASSHHRFAMVALAVAGHPSWRASDLEVGRAEPSYTADTLGRLHEDGFAPDDLVFIVGADAFIDIESWHAYPRVLDMARFAVVSRPGIAASSLRTRLPALAARMSDGADPAAAIVLLDRPTADVSATAIRRRLADGQGVSGLVPAAVAQHIEQHGLYRTAAAGSDAPAPHERRAAARLHGEE